MTGNGFFRYKAQKLVFAILVLFSVTQQLCAKDVVVSSAISLKDAFQDMALVYEKSHSQDKVMFNFGASGSLMQQIAQGAPVDVFASADEATMNLAQQKDLIVTNSKRDFTCNHLVLVTSSKNPLSVRELSDLKQVSIKRIAIGQVVSVPAGHYTQQALQKAGLWQELQAKLVPAQNVRQVLDYVARDDVDIGFVYESDALVFPDKVRILFRIALPNPVQYPIALVRNDHDHKAAQGFIDFILSSQGQAILRNHGFSACHS